ncbi:MAG TPA: NUDIX hydrolase [Verrucomicrobiae bacterium]|nr:NUDIX hydrolase [Verrucomicrobiae bacterium]
MTTPRDSFELGVKAFIRDTYGQVLLLHVPQEKTSHPGGYWDMPGGKVEENENMVVALRREVKTKTKIIELFNIGSFMMVFPNVYFRYDDVDAGLIMAVHSCDVPAHVGYEINDEYDDSQWCSLDEAAELLRVKYPKEFVKKVLDLKNSQE